MTSRFYGFGQSFVIVHRTQVFLVDRGADSAAQVRTCFLVGPKMYPAVNACVGDIVGDLLTLPTVTTSLQAFVYASLVREGGGSRRTSLAPRMPNGVTFCH
jgi:hypothetical protein